MAVIKKRPAAYDRDLLHEIIDVGTRLLNARYGALGLLNERRDAFECFITAGEGKEESSSPGPLPRGWGLMDALIQDPRPIRLSAPRESRPQGRRTPPHSFLGLPLVSDGRQWGNFYFADKEGEPEFHPADERLAECIVRLTVDYLEGNISPGEIRRLIGLFHDALEATAAVCITNPAREIVFWNRGARRLFGFTEREALGRPFAQLLVPREERQRWKKGLNPRTMHKLQDGEVAGYEGLRLHKDGRGIPVRATLYPVLHRVAGIVAITCIGHYVRA